MKKTMRIWKLVDSVKLIRTLSLYHESVRKTEEHDGKKYFMVDDYILHKY